MVYIFLANGFEEVEALAPIDILRRAGISVCSVGIGGRTITGSHGITVTADTSDNEFDPADMRDIEAVILPGGMPGAANLDASPAVDAALRAADAAGAYLCAICAAPLVLGRRGYLGGYAATCFPGFEGELRGALVAADRVVTDRRRITAAGMGVAIEFGLAITAALCGAEKANELRCGFLADSPATK